LDKKKYDDMKQFEMKKISIDEKRLTMEEEERDLKREHIKSQTTLEKNKALLVRMEIFKMRQALKKSDPSLTDEFLDTQFPY
jgi:fido (protein-threonine AMPylation protein)